MNTPTSLPSAFYDLRRYPASGSFMCAPSSPPSEPEHLSEQDLVHLLKGKEHVSRFSLTFSVKELKAREPSANCLHRSGGNPLGARQCQASFEPTTLQILRHLNGPGCFYLLDPLIVIMNSNSCKILLVALLHLPLVSRANTAELNTTMLLEELRRGYGRSCPPGSRLMDNAGIRPRSF